MNSNSKIIALVLVIVAVSFIGWWRFGCKSMPYTDSWTANVQMQKRVPLQLGTFEKTGQPASALQYRVFKPAIDIDKIPDEPKDWRKDPVDSFLRKCYIDLLDPEPTFAKMAEGQAEGMKPIERTLEKVPQFRNDPKGYCKKFRGNYTERKLLGEIVIENVHMFVAVFVDEYGPFKRGYVFIKSQDGCYYEDEALKGRNKTLDALARDHYSIIFKHFPEYSRKK